MSAAHSAFALQVDDCELQVVDSAFATQSSHAWAVPTHFALLQVCVPVHALSQAPQFWLSVFKSTHWALQELSPFAQP